MIIGEAVLSIGEGSTAYREVVSCTYGCTGSETPRWPDRIDAPDTTRFLLGSSDFASALSPSRLLHHRHRRLLVKRVKRVRYAVQSVGTRLNANEQLWRVTILGDVGASTRYIRPPPTLSQVSQYLLITRVKRDNITNVSNITKKTIDRSELG